MNSIARSFASIILLASASAFVSAARAQVARGTIRGTVRDELGRPVAGAQLVVKNTDIRATTDMAGKYILSGVWPGETEVETRRILFLLQKTTVHVPAGDTARADIALSFITHGPDDGPDAGGVVTLKGVETKDVGTSSRMAGFEERRARGGGGFITRADIERRHPSVLSDMLRGVSGVSVTPSGSAREQAKVQIERSSRTIASGACEVQLYVDGHPYPRGNVDDFPPETVEGVEVYRGGAELPSEFRSQNSGCGLIAIWTRDPAALRRQPDFGR